MKKKCPKCNEEKKLKDFSRNKSRKSGYQSYCKKCSNSIRKNNPQYFKYKNKEYYENNRDKVLEYGKKYREENKEYFSNYAKEYRIKNKNKIAEYQREKRRKNSIFKLQGNLRNRIYIMFKFFDWKKNKSTEEILGCTFEEAKAYIESTFTEGMTWENYGEWHIDHIIPLSSANTKEKLYGLCHYTNLQALWAFDNISKSNNY